MTIELLCKGMMIGFSIAMPVGPIGLLCIRNVLTYGILCGLVTGLGAACADALYGALAGFGVTAISTFLAAYGFYLQMAGALFLCYLGIATFFTKTTQTSSKEIKSSHFKAFIGTFLLTLTNPITIISFAGIYAGLGIGQGASDVNEALVITLGVFLGSAAWWIVLSLASSIFKEKMNAKTSIWLNKFSGSVLLGLGVGALVA